MTPAASRSTFVLLAAAVMVFIGGLAWACVPQVGGVEVSNPSNSTATNAGQSSASGGDIVGDGNPLTQHVNSWCGDVGGHPTSAVYAADGDTLELDVRAAVADEVAPGCPVQDNQLPPDNDIWLENGHGSSGADVYEWDETSNPAIYPNGFWNQGGGDGTGCYNSAGGADPVKQGTISVGSNGSGSTTFELETDHPTLGSGNTNTDQNDDGPGSNEPGDGASLLCVGDDLDDDDPEAIFAPVVVTQV